VQIGSSKGRCRDREVGPQLAFAGGYVRTRYSADEIDLVAAYCHELGRSYLLPFELLAGQTGIHLRLVPPKNGQRAALIWAADHQLSGAVAQLGERRSGTPKATGSSPVSSTPSESASHTVGAHQFRNHFGWYMERTVAGQEFVVTRRGKPCVRLVPAHPRLPIAD
jgi:prevent-host-death family protein